MTTIGVGLLVVLGFLIVTYPRIDKVFRYRMKIIDLVFTEADRRLTAVFDALREHRNISKHNIELVEYMTWYDQVQEELKKDTYNKMILQFWKPFAAHYAGTQIEKDGLLP